MRLAELRIKNFKRIGSTECVIRIDEIVVLIGQNNCGKSTVLDAYEAFASSGEPLDPSYFHNKSLSDPIEIGGTFCDLNEQDLDTLGKKWKFDDANFGPSIKVRWVWEKPSAKGVKQSFNPVTGHFENGGVGGWDTLLRSRIPQPIRIRPSDSFEVTQQKMLAMLKEHVKVQLKAESHRKTAVIDELEKLTENLLLQSKQQFAEVSAKISQSVSGIFPGASVEVAT